MTVTPDDSALLQRLGTVLLNNLTSLLTLTFLHGNDVIIYPVNCSNTTLTFYIRHIHNSLLYRSTHHFVCPSLHR